MTIRSNRKHAPSGAPARWLVLGVAALALLAACGAAPSPTSTTAPTSAPATKPIASPAAGPVATAAPSAAPTGATPAVKAAAATPTGAAPPSRPASPATAAAPTGQAEAWKVEGQPVLQVAVATEQQRYVTTAAGLFALTGGRAERRASGGDWPNLIAAGPSVLVSGDREACGRGGGGAPLRRSVDGGKTWQAAQVSGGRTPLPARPIPTLGGDLFAVACDGLFRSTDSGGTWQRLAILEPDQEPIDVATTPDGKRLFIVALFGEGGLTRLLASERAGESWSAVRTLREGWGGGVVGVGREDGRPVIYFGSPLGVEVSRDGGAAWQAQNQGLDSTRLLADPRQAGQLPADEEAKLRRGVGIYSLAPRLDRPRTLLGGSDGVYLFGDGRWQKLPALNGQIVREVFYDLDGAAYARSDLGVFRLNGV